MKSFWQSITKGNAGDAILTGYKGYLKDMPVYDEVISLTKSSEGHSQYALDFGCGVGRNTTTLAKDYKKVVGFDLPNMIELVPDENKSNSILYTSDWSTVKSFRFDLVLASLVFQHIDDQELHDYLKDINTDKLVLHSRTWIDDTGTEVLTIVEQYFNIEHIEYQKDPNGNTNDHFLAVLRSKNAEASI